MIVVVIVGVLVLAFAIFGFATGLFSYLAKEYKVNKKKVKLHQSFYKPKGEIRSIKFDVPCDNLRVEKGESFSILYNNPYVDLNDADGLLTVKLKDGVTFDPDSDLNVGFSERADFIITFPLNHPFEDFDINIGTGSVKFVELIGNNCVINLGSGKVFCDSTDFEKKFEVNCGDADLIADDCEFCDAKVDIAKGAITLNAKLFGENKFDVGFGSMTINILRSMRSYRIYGEAKSGFIGFEGKRTSRIRHEASHYTSTVDCYIETGNMTINTLEE